MSNIYRPLNRVLVDILIVTNLGIFIASAIGLVKAKNFFLIAVPISLCEVLTWFVIIRNLFSVAVTQEKIVGPGPYFLRASIPLAQLHRSKSEERSRASIWWGYRDFWSQDLKTRIRLWRRLLGRRQIYKIWKDLGWGDQPPGTKTIIYYPPYSR